MQLPLTHVSVPLQKLLSLHSVLFSHSTSVSSCNAAFEAICTNTGVSGVACGGASAAIQARVWIEAWVVKYLTINTGIGFFAFANISVALCNAGAMVVTVISTVTGVFTIGSGVAPRDNRR